MKKDASSQWKDASNKCKLQPNDAKMRQRQCGSMRNEGKTHDWALDFEPLALPPDLPPVILMVWMGWLIWVR